MKLKRTIVNVFCGEKEKMTTKTIQIQLYDRSECTVHENQEKYNTEYDHFFHILHMR